MDVEPLQSDLAAFKAFEQPDLPDDGRALHDLLLTGDPTATSRIAVAFHALIEQRLRAAYPALHDSHLVTDAVNRAFVGYFQHPERYHTEKATLPAYLHMSAKGDLLNLLERERRRSDHERAWTDGVAELEDGAEQETEFATDDDVEREVLESMATLPAEVEALFPEWIDRQMLEMIVDGVRETDSYVALLAIDHLPPDEQAHLVKKHKDRIKRRVRRWLEQRPGGLHDE